MKEKIRKGEVTFNICAFGLKRRQTGFSDNAYRRAPKNTTEETKFMQRTCETKTDRPAAKQIDTLAAEFPAKTNYLYTTYQATASRHQSRSTCKKRSSGRFWLIGSGPYCIGSSVEFDWSCVNVVKTLKRPWA